MGLKLASVIKALDGNGDQSEGVMEVAGVGGLL